MMKILNKESVDECTGRGRVIEVRVDVLIAGKFADYLKPHCDVVSMRDKNKPVLVARRTGRFMFKAMIGTDRIDVVFEKEKLEENISLFKELIGNYNPS
jgi:hypothetical protein